MEGSGGGSSSGSSVYGCLEWKDHKGDLISFLSSLLVNENFADVTLVSNEGTRIRAHRIVLSAFSPYFQRVLRDNPCKHPVIILKDVQFVDLQAIVNLIYHGMVHVEVTRMKEIIQTASTFQIKGLTETEAEIPAAEDFKLGTPERRCSSPVDNSSPIVLSRTPSPSPSPSIISGRVARPVRSFPSSSQPPETIEKVPVRNTLAKKSASDDLPYSSTSGRTSKPESERQTEHIGSSRSMPVGKQGSDTSFTNQSSFVITTRKKKEAWLDPDAISASRSFHNKKRYKQTSLLKTLAGSFPTPKVDVTKSNQYNGGNRSTSQATSSLPVDKNQGKEKKAGTKRKSDESVEGDGNLGSWDSQSLDTSDTFFDATSYDMHTTPSTPPRSGPSKPKENVKSNKPRSPLSPGKTNIMEPAAPVEDKYMSSKTEGERRKFPDSPSTSTLDIFRDFDKIPEYKALSPKKPGRLQGKKKQDREKEELVCTCIAADELGDHVDKKELARNRCDIHGTGEPPLLPCNTPENFWCTVQYNTHELYDKGLINVASPFTPIPRRRRRNSDDTFVDSENMADLDL